MFMIEVRAWTDRSSCKPKPKFSVQVIQQDDWGSIEGPAEQVKATKAREGLENELKQVSEEIHELIPRVGSEGYSKYALYAMVFLAAARAKVNPARIKFVYADSSPEEPYYLHSMFYDLVDLVKWLFNLYRDAMKNVMETRRRAQQYSNVPRTSEVIERLIQTISRMSDKPDESTLLLLIYLLKSFAYEVQAFEARVHSALSKQNVKNIFQKAADEAQDRDVKRLAEIFTEIIGKAETIAKELESYLDFLAQLMLSLLDKLSSPEKFKEVKEEVLKMLEEARELVRKIESDVESLIFEAEEIIERLENRGVLLDVEKEREKGLLKV